MAKEKNVEKAEPVTTPGKPEPTFRLDKLRSTHSAIFGVDEATFIGATASLSDEKEYTVSEIKTTIERWRAKEAK